MSRLTAGFLVCTLSFPALVALVGGQYSAAGAFVVLCFTSLGGLLAGIPCFLFLRRKGRLGGWHFVGLGAGIGALLALPFAFVDLSAFLLFLAYFVALGIAHAGVFWLIAVRNNVALHGEKTCVDYPHDQANPTQG